MFQNYFNKTRSFGSKLSKYLLKNKLFNAFVYVLWVLVAFILAWQLVSLAIATLQLLGVQFSLINESVFYTSYSVFVYLLAITITIGLPRLVKKEKTTLKEVGLDRLASWMDVVLAPAGLVVYMLVSVVIMAAANALFPWFDANQTQDVGFDSLFFQYEYMLAFVTLVVIVPFAEEVLFRGYLFSKLAKLMPMWAVVVVTSLIFGFVHGAWNLAFDTFALGVVLATLRIITNGLWAPIMLHMLKNGLAFYLLFINPSLLTTMGG